MAEETTQSPGDETRRAALVVAVSRYSDPMLRQLRAPAEDAAELGTVLGDPELGDFFVTTVTDGRAHEIRIAVEEFLAEQRPGDLSLVYLSCHGLMDARRRLYFAATDTLKDRLAATGIEARWLLDQLEECRARRQVIILDCCFSGAFAAGSKGDGDLMLGDRFLGQGRGRVVLTASRGTEYSFEGSPTPHSAIPGSVFTSALAAGISTGAADSDNDGWITVDDAYAYAFDEMRAAGAEQTPQRWLYGAEGGIVLARNPTAAAGSGPLPRMEPTARPSPDRRDAQAERDDRVNLPRVRAPRFNFRERWRRYAAVSGALIVAAIAGVSAYNVFSSPAPGFSFKNNVVESTGPWRMHIFSDVADRCTVTLTDLDRGTKSTVPRDPAYGESMWQMQATGRFRLEPSQTGCEINAENGAGDASIPLKVIRGESESFNPSGTFTVRVEDNEFNGDTCKIDLRDGETGTIVDRKSVTPQRPTQQMDPGPRSSVYLSNVPCPVAVIDN
jgi:Caspase domain